MLGNGGLGCSDVGFGRSVVGLGLSVVGLGPQVSVKRMSSMAISPCLLLPRTA